MSDLTLLQRRILAAIRRRSERGEAPPTYRDLCAEFGWSSTGTARDHLQALARKGYVELGEGRARRIRLTDQVLALATTVQVVGVVAAGSPVGAEEVDLGMVPAPSDWGRSSKLFALRVSGQSMRDSGILDGDVVVVRRQTSAGNNDIVVASLEGGTTLKRLRVEEGRAVLVPDNPAFSAIPVGEDGVAVHGVVVGLLRRFSGPLLATARRVALHKNSARRSVLPCLEKK
ncbi:MAG TPA: transcriptional repressor LexA [Deltaproteobacteria bacterium]|nr:transcriptional repressor LexA [Deltaproteobacteria bacterium]